MCDYLSTLTTSDVTAIITVLIALPSTWFLFKTFQSQKDSTEIARETSIIDRKAKRGEYLPEISAKIHQLYYPFPQNEYGDTDSTHTYYSGDYCTQTVEIIFRKNGFQLLEWEYENTSEHLEISSNLYPFDKDRIHLPETCFKINYKINFKKYFDLPSKILSPSLQQLEDDIHEQKPHESLSFINKLYFTDMLGNKYVLTFNVKGLEELIISDLKMID